MKTPYQHIIAITIIVCTVTQAFTQGQAPPQGRILGLVQDSKNNQSIEFATISVYRLSDSSLVTGGITDEKGAYEIQQIPVGQYYAQMDFVGYQSQIQNFSITTQLAVVTLSPTLLEIAAATLQTAEVTAESSDMQLGIDRKIFDVEKSQLNKGGNAIDVLRNTPTLDVDMNGNVSFRGSQGVNILINGKPSGLDGASREAILKQIPANMIKSIEIISSPSAKYDPDGISGIINIVLKKNKMQGFSGNVSYSIGTLGNFDLPLDFGAQFNLRYRAPMYLVIGSITGNFHSSFAVSKSFLKKSLKITLSIDDPFGVESFGYDLASDNYVNHGFHRWESRVAYLTISYDFGKMDMMTKRRMNQRDFEAGV